MLPYVAGVTLSQQNATLAGVLDPFNSRECNAHLVILIFDVILLTLFPEMAAAGDLPSSGEEEVGEGTTMIIQENDENDDVADDVADGETSV